MVVPVVAVGGGGGGAGVGAAAFVCGAGGGGISATSLGTRVSSSSSLIAASIIVWSGRLPLFSSEGLTGALESGLVRSFAAVSKGFNGAGGGEVVALVVA